LLGLLSTFKVLIILGTSFQICPICVLVASLTKSTKSEICLNIK
jgi:hypothetical protein